MLLKKAALVLAGLLARYSTAAFTKKPRKIFVRSIKVNNNATSAQWLQQQCYAIAKSTGATYMGVLEFITRRSPQPAELYDVWSFTKALFSLGNPFSSTAVLWTVVEANSGGTRWLATTTTCWYWQQLKSGYASPIKFFQQKIYVRTSAASTTRLVAERPNKRSTMALLRIGSECFA